MSFFDSKQEVLKIELTPYGKNLLANGKFKPEYYSFHDDEILYDVNYANSSELQNSSSLRIMDETIYLKPQGRIRSVEYTSKNIKPVDETTDNNLFLTILGNSSLNSDYKPAWNLRFLKSFINDSSVFYTGSSVQFLPIPQINLSDIFFELKIRGQNEEKSATDFNFLDGTSLSLNRDFILLSLEELNVDQHESNKNFEIELFEVDTRDSIEYLNKINFPPEELSIINNILLDKPQLIMNSAERQRLNLVLSDNYFNMIVDEEIDLELLLGAEQDRKQPEAETKTKPPFGEDC